MEKIFDISFYSSPKFHLHVDMTDACNYNCSYCYNRKPRTNAFIDVDKLICFIDQLRKKINKKIQIWVLGGEPTLHPKLIDFLCHFKDLKKFIYTNLTANIETYEKIAKTNTYMFVSYHPSFANSDMFMSKMKVISNLFKHSMKIILMDETEHKTIISKVNKLLFGFIEYQQIETSSIFNNDNSPDYTRKNTMCHGNSSVEKTYVMQNANKCIKLTEDELFSIIGKNTFKGMMCNASIDCIYINQLGNIFSCPSEYYFNDTSIPIGNICSSVSFKAKMKLCTHSICCIPHIMKIKMK